MVDVEDLINGAILSLEECKGDLDGVELHRLCSAIMLLELIRFNRELERTKETTGGK